uniref:Uncharacterized protein n=1 Tax=Candidatus Kentrum sp. LFY TaxID=2126342 RepID=A0A450UYU3_9GAMM|nr:MAG: hypothetical protein BECKLFY1418A_GA0070994_10731 [Candidatus Kentron sp. LFY]
MAGARRGSRLTGFGLMNSGPMNSGLMDFEPMGFGFGPPDRESAEKGDGFFGTVHAHHAEERSYRNPRPPPRRIC